MRVSFFPTELKHTYGDLMIFMTIGFWSFAQHFPNMFRILARERWFSGPFQPQWRPALAWQSKDFHRLRCGETNALSGATGTHLEGNVGLVRVRVSTFVATVYSNCAKTMRFESLDWHLIGLDGNVKNQVAQKQTHDLPAWFPSHS